MTLIRNVIPKTSEYLSSGFQASLADGAEIDSGWIDMEEFDKYQFEGRSGVTGMTQIITSSRVDGGGQPDDVISSNDVENTYQLFNVICRQRFIRFQWVNNTGAVVNNCSLAIKAFRGASDKLSVFSLATDPTDFSQAALTQSVLIGRDPSGDYKNTLVNSGGAILTGDFFSEVALGNIPNYQVGSKFGRNPQINVGVAEDMWNGGNIYTGHPVGFTPETVEVFSSVAADNSAGTGARTVRITGLKTATSTDYETEDIIMNGTTPVVSVNSWYRINRATVLTAGTGGQNAGNITVRPTVNTANVFVVMPIGLNQSTIGAFTVPFGKTMIIKRIRTTIVRSNGSAGSATVSLRVRPVGGVYNAVRVFELQTGGTTNFTALGGVIVPQGADIKFRIDSVSDNNTTAEGAFEYVLIEN